MNYLNEKNFKKFNTKKSQNGITLIALVITIIVLLILAGVSIMMLTGDNSILRQTTEAKKATEIANIIDSIKLDITGVQTSNYGYITESEVNNILENYDKDGKSDKTNSDGDRIIETTDGYEINVSDILKDIFVVDDNDNIDWAQILNDLPTKYDEYLELAKDKGQDTEENIGIGTDGKVVNLDLWHYYKTDDGESMSLGKGHGSETLAGYDGKNLIDGKIQGTMPQYVYIKSEKKIYPITTLISTFRDSYSLLEVPELPSTLTSLGELAFAGTSITNIIIPNGVTSIGNAAFDYCYDLTSITISSSVTDIASCFDFCGLTSIKVEESNTKYDSRDNCNAIIETSTNTLVSGCKNSTIPSSVTSIGRGAFEYRDTLENIDIPTGVSSIGDYAFYCCRNLTNITIPNSVTSIGNSAFYSCSALTNITIPNSVTNIGNGAFASCSSLTSVYFEHTTTPTFGSDCFYKSSGTSTTFYFKNETVYNAFTTSYYNSSYGTKSTDYTW